MKNHLLFPTFLSTIIVTLLEVIIKTSLSDSRTGNN